MSASRKYKTYLSPFIDSTKVEILETLTGENAETELISPETFEQTADYVKLSNSNMVIIDPISSSKMRIGSQEEFLSNAYSKYPFLKNLNFTNIALAGGFCRSILLKQEMKDFDFFFYGLGSDAEYEERFRSFVIELVNAVRLEHHTRSENVKFMMMFKPTYNVFEIICYTDPTNYIDGEFTLENFHSNKFTSMRKFKGNVAEVGAHDTDFVKVVEQKLNQESDLMTNLKTFSQ